METKTTVRELLNTPYLKDLCTVVAGKNGLDRQVTWVHITGIHELAGQYVDGGELVLAISKKFYDKTASLRFVKELIDKNVAALCIDTVLYYSKIDDELIQLADKYDTPLLQLHQYARFLDISKGLNTLILNKQSDLFRSADQYDTALAALGISASMTEKIRSTADYLNLDAAFLPASGSAYYTNPSMKEQLPDTFIENLLTLKENEVCHHGSFIGKNIFVFHKNYGQLIFSTEKRILTDLDELILSRLIINLRNTLMREMKENELRLLRSHQWIEKWISGLLDEEAVRASLQSLGYTETFDQLYVCSILAVRKTLESEDAPSMDEFTEHALMDTFLSGISIMFRKAYEEEKLTALAYVKDPAITYIFLGKADDASLPHRIEAAVRKVQQTDNPYMDFSRSLFSVGKKASGYSDIKRSMATSLEMLNMPELFDRGLIFFDRQLTCRLFKKTGDPVFLNQFAADCLGPLLSAENEILFHTLKVYYEHCCAKQQTAEALYITRPALYARLKKIADILGHDFDRGEKRFACETAVHIKAYLDRR